MFGFAFFPKGYATTGRSHKTMNKYIDSLRRSKSFHSEVSNDSTGDARVSSPINVAKYVEQLEKGISFTVKNMALQKGVATQAEGSWSGPSNQTGKDLKHSRSFKYLNSSDVPSKSGISHSQSFKHESSGKEQDSNCRSERYRPYSPPKRPQFDPTLSERPKSSKYSFGESGDLRPASRDHMTLDFNKNSKRGITNGIINSESHQLLRKYSQESPTWCGVDTLAKRRWDRNATTPDEPLMPSFSKSTENIANRRYSADFSGPRASSPNRHSFYDSRSHRLATDRANSPARYSQNMTFASDKSRDPEKDYHVMNRRVSESNKFSKGSPESAHNSQIRKSKSFHEKTSQGTSTNRLPEVTQEYHHPIEHSRSDFGSLTRDKSSDRYSRRRNSSPIRPHSQPEQYDPDQPPPRPPKPSHLTGSSCFPAVGAIHPSQLHAMLQQTEAVQAEAQALQAVFMGAFPSTERPKSAGPFDRTHSAISGSSRYRSPSASVGETDASKMHNIPVIQTNDLKSRYDKDDVKSSKKNVSTAQITSERRRSRDITVNIQNQPNGSLRSASNNNNNNISAWNASSNYDTPATLLSAKNSEPLRSHSFKIPSETLTRKSSKTSAFDNCFDGQTNKDLVKISDQSAESHLTSKKSADLGRSASDVSDFKRFSKSESHRDDSFSFKPSKLLEKPKIKEKPKIFAKSDGILKSLRIPDFDGEKENGTTTRKSVPGIDVFMNGEKTKPIISSKNYLERDDTKLDTTLSSSDKESSEKRMKKETSLLENEKPYSKRHSGSDFLLQYQKDEKLKSNALISSFNLNNSKRNSCGEMDIVTLSADARRSSNYEKVMETIKKRKSSKERQEDEAGTIVKGGEKVNNGGDEEGAAFKNAPSNVASLLKKRIPKDVRVDKNEQHRKKEEQEQKVVAAEDQKCDGDERTFYNSSNSALHSSPRSSIPPKCSNKPQAAPPPSSHLPNYPPPPPTDSLKHLRREPSSVACDTRVSEGVCRSVPGARDSSVDNSARGNKSENSCITSKSGCDEIIVGGGVNGDINKSVCDNADHLKGGRNKIGVNPAGESGANGGHDGDGGQQQQHLPPVKSSQESNSSLAFPEVNNNKRNVSLVDESNNNNCNGNSIIKAPPRTKHYKSASSSASNERKYIRELMYHSIVKNSVNPLSAAAIATNPSSFDNLAVKSRGHSELSPSKPIFPKFDKESFSLSTKTSSKVIEPAQLSESAGRNKTDSAAAETLNRARQNYFSKVDSFADFTNNRIQRDSTSPPKNTLSSRFFLNRSKMSTDTDKQALSGDLNAAKEVSKDDEVDKSAMEHSLKGVGLDSSNKCESDDKMSEVEQNYDATDSDKCDDLDSSSLENSLTLDDSKTSTGANNEDESNIKQSELSKEILEDLETEIIDLKSMEKNDDNDEAFDDCDGSSTSASDTDDDKHCSGGYSINRSSSTSDIENAAETDIVNELNTENKIKTEATQLLGESTSSSMEIDVDDDDDTTIAPDSLDGKETEDDIASRSSSARESPVDAAEASVAAEVKSTQSAAKTISSTEIPGENVSHDSFVTKVDRNDLKDSSKGETGSSALGSQFSLKGDQTATSSSDIDQDKLGLSLADESSLPENEPDLCPSASSTSEQLPNVSGSVYFEDADKKSFTLSRPPVNTTHSQSVADDHQSVVKSDDNELSLSTDNKNSENSYQTADNSSCDEAMNDSGCSNSVTGSSNAEQVEHKAVEEQRSVGSGVTPVASESSVSEPVLDAAAVGAPSKSVRVQSEASSKLGVPSEISDKASEISEESSDDKSITSVGEAKKESTSLSSDHAGHVVVSESLDVTDTLENNDTTRDFKLLDSVDELSPSSLEDELLSKEPPKPPSRRSSKRSSSSEGLSSSSDIDRSDASDSADTIIERSRSDHSLRKLIVHQRKNKEVIDSDAKLRDSDGPSSADSVLQGCDSECQFSDNSEEGNLVSIVSVGGEDKPTRLTHGRIYIRSDSTDSDVQIKPTCIMVTGGSSGAESSEDCDTDVDKKNTQKSTLKNIESGSGVTILEVSSKASRDHVMSVQVTSPDSSRSGSPTRKNVSELQDMISTTRERQEQFRKTSSESPEPASGLANYFTLTLGLDSPHTPRRHTKKTPEVRRRTKTPERTLEDQSKTLSPSPTLTPSPVITPTPDLSDTGSGLPYEDKSLEGEDNRSSDADHQDDRIMSPYDESHNFSSGGEEYDDYDSYDHEYNEENGHDDEYFDDEYDDDGFEIPNEDIKNCKPPFDFKLHTIIEESCEESDYDKRQKDDEVSIQDPSELEKYFFFGLGNGLPDGQRVGNEESEDSYSESSSSIFNDCLENDPHESENIDPAELASSRLEQYFRAGLTSGFERQPSIRSVGEDSELHTDESGSVGSDSEGSPSPEQPRKKLLRPRGLRPGMACRGYSSDRGDNPSDGSHHSGEDGDGDRNMVSGEDEGSTESEDIAFDKVDGQFDTIKRRKKKKNSSDNTDRRSDNEKGESKALDGDGREDSKLSEKIKSSGVDQDQKKSYNETDAKDKDLPSNKSVSELSERKYQSRDSGFIGSSDDLLKDKPEDSNRAREQKEKSSSDSSVEDSENFRSLKSADKSAVSSEAGGASGHADAGFEENNNMKAENEDRRSNAGKVSRSSTGSSADLPPFSKDRIKVSRKDSFNWSSDEETNIMMNRMRAFFRSMLTKARDNPKEKSAVKSPQMLLFEAKLTSLMKKVPDINDEQVREIVEYLSSEDTWSDSCDSSDYTTSDLEGTYAFFDQHGYHEASELREQISASCQEIIEKFDQSREPSDTDSAHSFFGSRAYSESSDDPNTMFMYQRLLSTIGRMKPDSDRVSIGSGSQGASPPLLAKVFHHIGTSLVELMHEVSGGSETGDDIDSLSGRNMSNQKPLFAHPDTSFESDGTPTDTEHSPESNSGTPNIAKKTPLSIISERSSAEDFTSLESQRTVFASHDSPRHYNRPDSYASPQPSVSQRSLEERGVTSIQYYVTEGRGNEPEVWQSVTIDEDKFDTREHIGVPKARRPNKRPDNRKAKSHMSLEKIHQEDIKTTTGERSESLGDLFDRFRTSDFSTTSSYEQLDSDSTLKASDSLDRHIGSSSSNIRLNASSRGSLTTSSRGSLAASSRGSLQGSSGPEDEEEKKNKKLSFFRYSRRSSMPDPQKNSDRINTEVRSTTLPRSTPAQVLPTATLPRTLASTSGVYRTPPSFASSPSAPDTRGASTPSGVPRSARYHAPGYRPPPSAKRNMSSTSARKAFRNWNNSGEFFFIINLFLLSRCIKGFLLHRTIKIIN